MATELFWKCGCGKVKVKLAAEPFGCANCHCHSCVACSRFVDEKHKDETEHVSGIMDGGTALAFFKPNQVTLLTSTDDLSLKCMKVGPKGKGMRKYVQCCGTQFGVTEKAFWVLNRNAIYKDEAGTEKYAPEKTVVNSMKKFAFEPDQVPEPNSTLVPLGVLPTLLGVVLNPFGPSTDKETLETWQGDPETADEVPITWE